jgi:hypothetical protein
MHSPVPVVGALAAVQIEQFARDICRVDAAGIFIFNLVQAAFTAAVA